MTGPSVRGRDFLTLPGTSINVRFGGDVVTVLPSKMIAFRYVSTGQDGQPCEPTRFVLRADLSGLLYDVPSVNEGDPP